jgi:DNA-binding NtrC family response regulator/pSer/pThr/pTyr-binding forkhead associated (FHA) protein
VLRLIAYVEDGARRFPLVRDEMVVGRDPRCEICLPYHGIADRHALVRVRGDEVEVEDLGSRRGVAINGERVKLATMRQLDELRVGTVSLLLEEVEGEAVAIEPPSSAEPAGDVRPEVLLEHLSTVSRWVLEDAASRRTLESLVTALLREFGGGAAVLLQRAAEGESVRFTATTDARWLGIGEELRTALGDRDEGELMLTPSADRPAAWVHASSFEAVTRRHRFFVVLPPREAGAWNPGPGLSALGRLIAMGLIHHVGRYEPLLPGKEARPGLRLHTGLVAGESRAMRSLLDQLDAALDPSVAVLLIGEPGSGRELVARSLHQSSDRAAGPFLTASCGGAELRQIEVDLFGAEVPGRDGRPLRREGKLVLAAGGTLLLQDVDQLPLVLQGRLVRFLRTGEVEASGSLAAEASTARLVATSTAPLDPLVANGSFRGDLAYRLAQVTVHVPPLRERREDLPLLLQAAINRFCHATGKRVQGIGLRAMGLLTRYAWPGNLLELEAVVRQAVALCPEGQPIAVEHLPQQVRSAELHQLALQEPDSELDLERITAACEIAAIREALRRTRGNRSEAARLLGLSRNGLALKMRRHAFISGS